MKFDLTDFKRTSGLAESPEKRHPVKSARGVSYRVGTWDGRTKLDQTDLPLPDSLKCSVTYASYLDAHQQAKRDSHHYSECDFDAGTEGKRIVLILFRNDAMEAVWEFDRNGRERAILPLT